MIKGKFHEVPQNVCKDIGLIYWKKYEENKDDLEKLISKQSKIDHYWRINLSKFKVYQNLLAEIDGTIGISPTIGTKI